MLLNKSDGRIGITLSSSHTARSCLVAALEDGSLGFLCGLYVGDTLIAVNGVLCHGDHRLAIELVDEAPQLVELVVVASTREVTLSKGSAPVGLTVADRTDGGAGVVVIGLQPGSVAIGQLELGEMLLSVNGELVATHRDAIELVDAAPCMLQLVLGERSEDFHRILDSVNQSSSLEAIDVAIAPGCEPTARHEPLHTRNSNRY